MCMPVQGLHMIALLYFSTLISRVLQWIKTPSKIDAVARMDFDLPAMFRSLEAIDVQCWWPSDELLADRRYDVMPSREAEEGYF